MPGIVIGPPGSSTVDLSLPSDPELMAAATPNPETEAGKPAIFTVACPDAAGNPVVIYRFNLTHWGWRFVALDNLNE